MDASISDSFKYSLHLTNSSINESNTGVYTSVLTKYLYSYIYTHMIF